MTPTKHEGLYYRKNKHNKKVFYARFKVSGKAYLKKLGVEPGMNTTTANIARLDLIAQTKGSVQTNGKTIDMFFGEYIESRRHSLSESWYYNLNKNYNKHLKDAIGDKYPHQVNAADIQSIIQDMLSGNNDKKKKYAPATVKQLKDCTTGVYDYVRKQGVKVHNIGRDLMIPTFDNKIYFSISDRQAQKLFDTILNYEDLKWRAYFVWLLHGRRKMEVAVARWEWLDFEKRIYVIPQNQNKSAKEIVAPLTPVLVNALKKLDIKDNGYIFESQTSTTGHISSTGVDFQWRNIRALAGIPKMRLHDIRHLIGHLSISDGFGLEMIGAVLGHRSTATTKRYSNIRTSSAEEVLSSLFNKFMKE